MEICDWPLCRVLLCNDANYPWLILVPLREDLKDFHDLATDDQPLVMDEVGRASRALQVLYGADKINVAALGNMVPQLHIHVIARFTTDPAWPAPVWGVRDAVPYEPEVLAKTVERLRGVLRQKA